MGSSFNTESWVCVFRAGELLLLVNGCQRVGGKATRKAGWNRELTREQLLFTTAEDKAHLLAPAACFCLAVGRQNPWATWSTGWLWTQRFSGIRSKEKRVLPHQSSQVRMGALNERYDHRCGVWPEVTRMASRDIFTRVQSESCNWRLGAGFSENLMSSTGS